MLPRACLTLCGPHSNLQVPLRTPEGRLRLGGSPQDARLTAGGCEYNPENPHPGPKVVQGTPFLTLFPRIGFLVSLQPPPTQPSHTGLPEHVRKRSHVISLLGTLPWIPTALQKSRHLSKTVPPWKAGRYTSATMAKVTAALPAA